MRMFITTHLIALAILISLVPATGVRQALAHGAQSVDAECVTPDLPPGTPTPMEEMGQPEGSPPAKDAAEMDMGTPGSADAVESGEGPLPAAALPTIPAGTPADADVEGRVIAGAENLVSCFGSPDTEAAAALMTTAFTLIEFGTDNPYDVARDIASDATPEITIESLGDAQTHDDGRLSVEIVFTGLFSPNTYLHHRWYFVPDGDHLKLDQWVWLPVETADFLVEITMTDFAYELSQSNIPAGQTIAFNGRNDGEYAHEIIVLQLPEGATVEQVVNGEIPEEDVRFYGFAIAAPGQTAHFGLTDLEPGTYHIICYFDSPDGIPHVMRGMEAEFVVE
ncbi:MAG: hypothetical protein H0U40_01345 [Chloroflexia bacterium]|nr:hypothetical protein [Chloroflexia bacterium]